MAEKLEINCPCCEALIVVDGLTGEILFHREKQRAAGAPSLEAMMSEMVAKKDEAEKRFTRNIESQKDRSRILDEKFKEAMQRADRSGKPPINPMDLD